MEKNNKKSFGKSVLDGTLTVITYSGALAIVFAGAIVADQCVNGIKSVFSKDESASDDSCVVISDND